MRLTRRELVGAVAGLALAAGRARVSARAIVPAAQGLPDVLGRIRSTDGLLALDLVAAEGWVPLAGASARLYAFNQQVPGPLLELQAGDEVHLRLVNQLSEPTNLHFHGLHIPPDIAASASWRRRRPRRPCASSRRAR